MARQALLFVDQVGSTRLLAEIGSKAMLDVRQSLHGMIRRAVASHGGRIFSDLGDGAAAVFGSATDAALAAQDMQRAADATHNSGEHPIELRVGVHLGEVVANGEGLIGMPVHVAARLCDAAPDGHIAASPSFCADLGPDVGVRSFERRVLKGIAEPMDVLLIIDPIRQRPTPKPRPVDRQWTLTSSPWLSERAAPTRFVGRDQERRQLLELGQTADTNVQLALVEGEPGIGKSTLLHDVGARFSERGHLCVVGRADETQPAPFREFIEALNHVAPQLPDVTIADHLWRHGHVLGPLIPAFGERSAPLVGLDRTMSATPEPGAAADDSISAASLTDDGGRFSLFEAIADVVRSITAHQPMVMLLEDLHWSTEPSLALLRHLVQSIDLHSLVIIASFRPTEVQDGGPLAKFLGKVAADTNVHRVPLGPLGLADVQALVADLPFAQVAKQLHEQTAGSPLFVAQMIRSVDERGRPLRAADGSLVVPETVQDLAAGRVDRLGPAHRALLADAAVLGRFFELADLEALSPAHIDVLTTLEEAEQAGIIVTDPVHDETFGFSHALIRDALYRRISAPRRGRRHGAAADVMLRADVQTVERRAAETLRHIDASKQERSPELVADLARAAARNSLVRLDLPEAVRYRELTVSSLQRRIDPTVEQTAELCQALIDLATVRTSAGLDLGRKTFVQAADLARSIERWDLLSEAAARYGGPVKENQAILDVSEPASLIVEALAHEAPGTPMRARLLTALATWQRQHVPYHERRRLGDEALAIARRLDDRRTLATVLAEVPRALHGPISTLEALEASSELERMAAEMGDDMIALQAFNLRLLSAFELGPPEELEHHAQQLAQLAERLTTIEGRRISLLWRATRASMAGDEIAHDQVMRELRRLLASFPPSVRAVMVGASSVMLPWFRGQSAELYPLSVGVAPPFLLALFAADGGRLDQAKAHIADGGGLARILQDQNYLFFLDVVAMTRFAVRSGDVQMAAELRATLLPYRGRNARMGLVAYLGAVDHHLGTLAALLGDTDEAAEFFRSAIDMHHRMTSPPWAALSLAELARITPAADRERFAAEARSIAEPLGLRLVLETLDEGASVQM